MQLAGPLPIAHLERLLMKKAAAGSPESFPKSTIPTAFTRLRVLHHSVLILESIHSQETEQEVVK